MGKFIEVRVEGLDTLRGDLGRADRRIERAMIPVFDRFGLNVQTAIKRRIRAWPAIRTGRYLNSVRVVGLASPRLERTVGPRVDYAVMIEEGTAAHDIVPVKAKALRFKVGNKVVFAKRVRHPGTKPKPSTVPALEAEQPRFIREINERVEMIMRGGT